MNNRIYYFLLFVSSLTGCTAPENRTEVYSVLHDITDPLQAIPDPDELIRFMDITEPDKTIVLRYAHISDVDFNTVKQLVRPQQQTGLLANQVQEKKKHRQFEKDVRKLFEKQDSLAPASHSSVFLPIIRELRYLASLPDEYTKHLIIYSDLMENNNDFVSFYQPKDIRLLHQHPDILKDRYLNTAGTLPAVSNLHVQVIFIPKDNTENTQYREIQVLYQNVFDELGIPITFSANLTNANKTP